MEELENVRFAKFFTRLLAIIIDGLIMIPLVLLELFNMTTLHSLIILLFGTIAQAAYKPVLEYYRGATFGKSAMGIRVVSEDLSPINAEQAFQRYIPWLINTIFSLFISYYYYTGGEYISSLEDIYTLTGHPFWSQISSMYTMIFFMLVGFAAFDRKSQGIHDKLAKTYVIHDKP